VPGLPACCARPQNSSRAHLRVRGPPLLGGGMGCWRLACGGQLRAGRRSSARHIVPWELLRLLLRRLRVQRKAACGVTTTRGSAHNLAAAWGRSVSLSTRGPEYLKPDTFR
jgi:hypothetical protein